MKLFADEEITLIRITERETLVRGSVWPGLYLKYNHENKWYWLSSPGFQRRVRYAEERALLDSFIKN